MDDPRDVDCDLIETAFTTFDRTARYAWRWAATRWRGLPSPSHWLTLIEKRTTAPPRGSRGGSFRDNGLPTFFGLVAVTLMLVFYWLEPPNRHYILAFAGACLLASAYGFLSGAWPFGWSRRSERQSRQSAGLRPDPGLSSSYMESRASAVLRRSWPLGGCRMASSARSRSTAAPKQRQGRLVDKAGQKKARRPGVQVCRLWAGLGERCLLRRLAAEK